jgi:hypothetical protein
LFLAIPPRSAVQLALQAVEAADGRMAGLTAELAARIEASDRSVSLSRSEHMREHVEQIKKALLTAQYSLDTIFDKSIDCPNKLAAAAAQEA